MTPLQFDATLNSIEQQFDNIAQQLFHSTKIIVNNAEFLLTEIEFYVHYKPIHPDPFVHNQEEQLKSNTWYFHGSGVDITLGNNTGDEETNTYGGILIRGIKRLGEIPKGELEYTDGSLNVVREFFKYFNFLNTTQEFGLVDCTKVNFPIYKTTRIGLNPVNKEKGEEYQQKHYRYLTDLETIAHKHKAKEYIDKNKVLINPTTI